MAEGLTLRQDYFADPKAFQALADLLHDVFGIDIALQNTLGGPDPTSMPFGYFDEAGRCVANFSAFSMPLRVNGRLVRAAGYQSGAVRQDFRGQGLYRQLMMLAFDRAKAQGFEAGILLTDKPALYEPYGFRVVPQFRSGGEAPEVRPSGPVGRTLDLTIGSDLHLVRQILRQRQPVSDIFSPVRQMEMFLLNARLDPQCRLTLLPLHGAVIAWKTDGKATLQILDIVAPSLPSVVEICAALGGDFKRIEVCFPTDRLDWAGVAMPHAGSCVLMLQGIDPDFTLQPWMLSPMAEF